MSEEKLVELLFKVEHARALGNERILDIGHGLDHELALVFIVDRYSAL
jgi:hypothetical protein